MKKVILALAIVSVSFAACNNGEDKKVEETTTSDTTVVATPDTSIVVTDTTVKTTIAVSLVVSDVFELSLQAAKVTDTIAKAKITFFILCFV